MNEYRYPAPTRKDDLVVGLMALLGIAIFCLIFFTFLLRHPIVAEKAFAPQFAMYGERGCFLFVRSHLFF